MRSRYRGQYNRLTRAERTILQPLPVVNEGDRYDVRDAEDGNDSDEEKSFVQHLQKQRRSAAVQPQYALINSIMPTSNFVECFFSALPGRRLAKSVSDCSRLHGR
ncbi:hypothetical protein PF004_g454 [Phytophthora fragariae]|uniref:Uncharacterized protein n=1 Tax=Phytophthora fragariae TaxID=53985 RepID=A0A6G0PVF4_9STRA|nr:hypothetical protein PF004_g454 [Phytophthora fragariae]